MIFYQSHKVTKLACVAGLSLLAISTAIIPHTAETQSQKHTQSLGEAHPSTENADSPSIRTVLTDLSYTIGDKTYSIDPQTIKAQGLFSYSDDMTCFRPVYGNDLKEDWKGEGHGYLTSFPQVRVERDLYSYISYNGYRMSNYYWLVKLKNRNLGCRLYAQANDQLITKTINYSRGFCPGSILEGFIDYEDWKNGCFSFYSNDMDCDNPREYNKRNQSFSFKQNNTNNPSNVGHINFSYDWRNSGDSRDISLHASGVIEVTTTDPNFQPKVNVTFEAGQDEAGQNLSFEGFPLTMQINKHRRFSEGYTLANIKAPHPTRQGYVLTGWKKKDANSETTIPSDQLDSQSVERDTTYTAQWAKEITVDFDASKPADAPESTSVQNVPAAQTFAQGRALSATGEPSLDGYVFRGWKLKDSNPEKIYQTNELTSFVPTDSVTLVAQWEKKITITFEDGKPADAPAEKTVSNMPSSQIIVKGDTITAPQSAPVLEDYVFVGWMEKSNTQDTSLISNEALKNISPTKNITYVAQWKKLAKKQGDTPKVTTGTTLPDTPHPEDFFDKEDIKKLPDGTKFEWDTSDPSHPTGKPDTNSAGTKKGKIKVVVPNNPPTVIGVEISVVDVVTITFDAAKPAGTGAAIQNMPTPLTRTLEKNSAVGDVSEPSLEGYSFRGWSANRLAGASDQIFTTEDIKTQKATSTTTYYAQWVKIHTVSFEDGKPEGAPNVEGMPTASIKKIDGEKLGGIEVPRLAYYHFSGWKIKGEDAAPLITDTTQFVVTKDLTLVAQWSEKEQYILKFYPNYPNREDNSASRPAVKLFDKESVEENKRNGNVTLTGGISTPEHPHYICVGWTETPAPNPTDTIFRGRQLRIREVLGSKDYYAQWKPLTQARIPKVLKDTQPDDLPDPKGLFGEGEVEALPDGTTFEWDTDDPSSAPQTHTVGTTTARVWVTIPDNDPVAITVKIEVTAPPQPDNSTHGGDTGGNSSSDTGNNDTGNGNTANGESADNSNQTGTQSADGSNTTPNRNNNHRAHSNASHTSQQNTRTQRKLNGALIPQTSDEMFGVIGGILSILGASLGVCATRIGWHRRR